MTEAPAKPPRRRWRYLIYATVVGWIIFGAVAWYTTTDSFQSMVRQRLVAELEAITGGRVELGGFHTTPFRLRVDVRDLTIHGKEGPNEVPYAHVDRLIAEMKVISVLGAEIGFDLLVLEHPVVHVILYPDGSTNQPAPKIEPVKGKPSVEELFALSIKRLEVRKGEFYWNDSRTPIDCLVHDVSVDMSYFFLRRRYEANVLLGKVDTAYDGYRPFSWTAQTHFVLSRTNIDIQSLKATSGKSNISVSGTIANFHEPHFEGSYQANLDLGEVAAITRRNDIRRGLFAITGKGSWSAKDFNSAGSFSLKDFDYFGEPMVLQSAAVNTKFALTPTKVAFTQVDALLLGGAASGDTEVSNWQELLAAPAKVKDKKAPVPAGTVRMAFKSISAAAIVSALTARSHPINRWRFVGLADASVDGRWQGSPKNIETNFAVDFHPPASLKGDELPVTARARGTYRAAVSELELADFHASTPGTQVQASGKLSTSASLKISATATDLGEWEPVLQAFGLSRLPVALHGPSTLNATATGKLEDVSLAGTIQAQNFDVRVPATARTPERMVHWDSGAADLQFSRHSIAARHGMLKHGDTSIGFDLSARLEDGHVGQSSPFTARLALHHADVTEMSALAGYSVPVTGTVNLNMVAAGTPAEPHGEGHIQLTNAVVYGEELSQLDADLHFVGSEWQLNNLDVSHYDGQLSGGLTYDLKTHAVRFNLTGHNFDLGRVSQLQHSRVKVGGRMDFTASGSGTQENPAINADIKVRDLSFDQERAGDYTLQAATQGKDLHLVGRSQFDHAQLDFDGDVQLVSDFPANVDIHLGHFDVDSLLNEYLGGRLTGHSSIAGEIKVDGPLRNPRDLNTVGELSGLTAEIEHIKIQNNGPVKFAISQQTLHIDQFRLQGEDTDLSATGLVSLVGGGQMDLKAQGHANLQLIQTFNSDFTSSGVVTVDVSMSGPVLRPVMHGRLQIQNGSIAYIDLPSALSDINGSLIFTRNRLEIEQLTARTGGGTVTFGGYAVAGSKKLNFDLTVHGQDVRLRYPPGVSSNATADLRWSGSTSESTLSGDITVNKLSLQPRFDFASYMARSAQQNALPQTNQLLNGIHLDIHVVTAPELQMQTASIRLSGDADLRMRGTAAKPVILGRADVTEGELYFNGAKYKLERGDVSFANPVSTRPVLDLQATTRVRDYDITVNLNGDPDHLQITYRSEPPLPEGDIIALLALGRTQEEASSMQQAGQSAIGQYASSAILAEALNATVSSRAQHLFGVSRIKVDPQGLSTETNTARGPQVTIEQQVTNNLTITYSTNVAQAAQQIIQVEYNINRTVSLVALRDQNGVFSFDIRIRQRKK